MKEALKLALEALENISAFAVGEGDVCEIIAKRARLAAKALEEALAPTSTQCEVQPEQEPIAIAECKVVHGHMCQFLKRTRHGMDTLKDGDKLYTTPPKPEPRNFCPRCGKRLVGMAFAAGGVHTCTPPRGLEMT